MAGEAGARGTHRHRVLICDDRPAVREMLALALSAFGYEWCGAGSGDEALRLLLDRPACAVLLDMRMPRMDGAAFLCTLAASAIRPRPPIVAMSGDDPSLLVAAEPGADAVLVKPFSVRALRALLHRVVAHESAPPARTVGAGG
jgi:CheY-like chemotaxis protein